MPDLERQRDEEEDAIFHNEAIHRSALRGDKRILDFLYYTHPRTKRATRALRYRRMAKRRTTDVRPGSPKLGTRSDRGMSDAIAQDVWGLVGGHAPTGLSDPGELQLFGPTPVRSYNPLLMNRRRGRARRRGIWDDIKGGISKAGDWLDKAGAKASKAVLKYGRKYGIPIASTLYPQAAPFLALGDSLIGELGGDEMSGPTTMDGYDDNEVANQFRRHRGGHAGKRLGCSR